MRKLDLTGKRFGRLVVVAQAPHVGRVIWWRARCDCGNEKSVPAANLRSGKTQSCGCLHRESAAQLCRDRETTHGLSSHRLYHVWVCMRARCRNPRDQAYRWYGGKGVKVCAEWDDFEAFYRWAITCGYRDGLSIDRINSNGNYEPKNCEWVTVSENARRMQASKKAA